MEKKYIKIDANAMFERNTNEEINEQLYGKNSIDAKWTRHIQSINEQLKNAGPYKAGRPRLQPQPIQEAEPGM